jgi:hypothetical protein
MLYPIELLRHTLPARNAERWTASMLTGTPAFVMSSVGFLSVGRCFPGPGNFTAQAKVDPTQPSHTPANGPTQPIA